jgi:hypothetical protein
LLSDHASAPTLVSYPCLDAASFVDLREQFIRVAKVAAHARLS